MKRIYKFIKKHEEIIRYVIAGGLTTLFNLLTFAFMAKVMHIEVNISNIVSVAFSILFAYAVNKLFVFKSNAKKFVEILYEGGKFIGSRLLTMLIEVGGFFLLVNVLNQDEILGKIEVQVIVLIANYLISKFVVFKVKEEKKDENITNRTVL